MVFTLVWIAWANGTLHHDLHGHDDARARSTFLLQILILAAMGAFIPQAGGARGAAFAIAAAVLFAVLAILWLLASRGDRPEYRRAKPWLLRRRDSGQRRLPGRHRPAARHQRARPWPGACWMPPTWPDSPP